MQVTDALLARAQRHDPATLRALLAEAYPTVRRIAAALVGREALADRIVVRVLARSLRVLPTWRRGTTPENWFYHHTLLAARSACRDERTIVEPLADVLVARSAEAANAEYVAFVRALRNLPSQQAEAFLLHHGERLNPRYLALAMDCSTAAAETHLRAATAALSAMFADGVASHAGAMARAYAGVSPGPGASDAVVQGLVASHLRPIRRRRRLRRIALVILACLFAFALWRWRALIR